MKRAILVLTPLAASLAALALGCSEKLETGYDPRRLGSSTEVRRGFYAAPFSPEARKAKEYQQDFGGAEGMGRPKPGY